MMTVVVEFEPPEPIPADRFAELAKESAHDYVGTLGLIAKNYVRSADGTRVAGIYLWATRHAAEANYDDAWRERVTSTYGSAPSFTWYESPVVLDNRHREILE